MMRNRRLTRIFFDSVIKLRSRFVEFLNERRVVFEEGADLDDDMSDFVSSWPGVESRLEFGEEVFTKSGELREILEELKITLECFRRQVSLSNCPEFIVKQVKFIHKIRLR